MTDSFIDALWDTDIVPTLTDYIRIPNKSPAVRSEKWAEHGLHGQAVRWPGCFRALGAGEAQASFPAALCSKSCG